MTDLSKTEQGLGTSLLEVLNEASPPHKKIHKILAFIDAYYKEKYRDYVKLADIQNQPNYPPEIRIGKEWIIHRRYYDQAKNDLIRAGWRKVELEVKE